MHELQSQLLVLDHSTCDDKTNKALLDKSKHQTDTLVLHKYDEQMLYLMNSGKQDLSIPVHANC